MANWLGLTEGSAYPDASMVQLNCGFYIEARDKTNFGSNEWFAADRNYIDCVAGLQSITSSRWQVRQDTLDNYVLAGTIAAVIAVMAMAVWFRKPIGAVMDSLLIGSLAGVARTKKASLDYTSSVRERVREKVDRSNGSTD